MTDTRTRHGLRLARTVVAFSLLFTAAPALAQSAGDVPRFSISARAGLFAPAARGDVFDFVTARESLSRRELHSRAGGVEAGLMLTDRIQLVAGVDGSRVTEDSRYHDRRRPDGSPILQSTRFSVGPRPYVGGRVYLRPPGADGPAWTHGVNAFAGAAVARGSYEFRQWGSFYDEWNDVVFDADFRSRSSGYAALLTLGLDVPLAPAWALTTEARYSEGRAGMRGDYLGFDPIDLGGLGLSIGLTFRR